MIDKVCLVNLNFTKELCSNLTLDQNKKYQEEVQVVTANLNMYLNILCAIPGIIMGWIMGPWSDINGRKPLMIIPQVGCLIAMGIFLLNTYFTQLSAEYLLFISIYACFGGFFSFLIGMYGFVADITEEQARTSRITLLDFQIWLGLPFGNIISGPIFEYGGYYLIFSLVRNILNDEKTYSPKYSNLSFPVKCTFLIVNFVPDIFHQRQSNTNRILYKLLQCL